MILRAMALHACGPAVVVLSLFAATSAWAQKKPTTEPAIVKSADDKDLKWGPAPAFMPKGTELTVLHGDPSKKNSDVMLKIPAKEVIPAHWHTSAERMILVSGELHVTYVGQEKAILKAGSYAYGPAKARHDAQCVSDVPCVLFIAFEGPVDAIPVEAKETNKKG